MTTTEDVTQTIIALLPTELDPALGAEGFQRSVNSLEYLRNVDAGTQSLKLVFDLSPGYEPRALAHVLPQIRFVFPTLNQRVLDIMGSMPSLEDANGVTVFQQIQNAAPREVRTARATRWFIFDAESARGCVVSMREFVKQWTVPYLNKHSTVAALVEGYEQEDDCLPHDRRFWLFIAAAYTLLKQPTKANEVLESRFGRPGTRRQYAKAFEYVALL